MGLPAFVEAEAAALSVDEEGLEPWPLPPLSAPNLVGDSFLDEELGVRAGSIASAGTKTVGDDALAWPFWSGATI